MGLQNFSRTQQQKIKTLINSPSYHGFLSLEKSGHNCKIGQNDIRWDIFAKELLKDGYDETELWNLYETTLKWFLPRLKAFREIHGDNPDCIYFNCKPNEAFNKWNETLDEMIWLCEELLSEKERSILINKRSCCEITEEEYKNQIKKLNLRELRAKKLFGDFFLHLWC